MSKLTALTHLTCMAPYRCITLVGMVLTLVLCKQAIYHLLYGLCSLDAYLSLAVKVSKESYGSECDASGNAVMYIFRIHPSPGSLPPPLLYIRSHSGCFFLYLSAPPPAPLLLARRPLPRSLSFLQLLFRSFVIRLGTVSRSHFNSLPTPCTMEGVLIILDHYVASKKPLCEDKLLHRKWY